MTISQELCTPEAHLRGFRGNIRDVSLLSWFTSLLKSMWFLCGASRRTKVASFGPRTSLVAMLGCSSPNVQAVEARMEYWGWRLGWTNQNIPILSNVEP